MEVLYDRVAAWMWAKASVTLCVRTPGARRSRHQETRTFNSSAGSLAVMRDWLVEARRHDRGDGVDLDVLESAVLLAGGGDRGLVAQRRAHEGGELGGVFVAVNEQNW